MASPSLFTVLVLSVVFLFSGPGSAAELLISGNPDLPPVSWEKQGKLLGVGPELATRVLSGLGIAHTLAPAGTWQQVQDKTMSGKVDMIVAAYDNAARRAGMTFSVPYLVSPVVIVVKRGEGFPVSSWGSLQGKKGVAHEGESFGEAFDAYIRKNLDVSYLPYERAFAALAEDSADYLIIDLYPAIIYARLLRAEDQVEFLARPVTVQQLHMAVSKRSPLVDRLPEINAALERLNRKEYIQQLVIEQYHHWTRTLAERNRFLARQQAEAREEQATYEAADRDRGMERLLRFLEQDYSYLDGSGVMVR